MPLAGDRNFGDDQAILGGLARFRGRRVMVIGHEKGDDIPSRMKHNFGMAKPEGYRKAIRLMQLADRFGLPVVTLVDTSGDRKSVVSGKSVSVRVDLGGRRIIKKKKNLKHNC